MIQCQSCPNAFHMKCLSRMEEFPGNTIWKEGHQTREGDGLQRGQISQDVDFVRLARKKLYCPSCYAALRDSEQYVAAVEASRTPVEDTKIREPVPRGQGSSACLNKISTRFRHVMCR